MLKIEKEKIEQFFKEYTDAYDSTDPKIKLKIDHTYRVAAIAEQIAIEEGLEDAELCWLCGMLHDVGRFEQVRRYGTFVDAKSIDHATFGADILFKEGLIAKVFPEAFRNVLAFLNENHDVWRIAVENTAGSGATSDAYISTEEKSPAEQDVINQKIADICAHIPELVLVEKAIRNHSRYRIENGLSEREITLCNVLRDADKIDILRVNHDTPMDEIYNTSMEALKKDDVTPEVLQAFQEHHAVLRHLKKTGIDNLVGHVSMLFELVYPASRRITAKQGYIWKLLAFETENPETKEILSYMKKEHEKFLNS